MSNQSNDETRNLLKSAFEGDTDSMNVLIKENLSWIQYTVRERMGPELRVEMDSTDVVQETVLRVLRQGPKYLVSDVKTFRAITARIAINILRDRFRRIQVQRRNDQKIIDLDRHGDVDGPITEAGNKESVQFVMLALELLSQKDRELIDLRQFQNLGFKEIAQRLESSPDAVRSGFGRALKRLAQRVLDLRTR